MRIYQLAVLEGYEWVLPKRKQDHETLTFDGTPRGTIWGPVPVELLRQDEDGKKLSQSDLPWLGAHAPVLRPRAVAALGGLLSRYGELLPLACADAELQIFNATSVVDALDLDRSEVVRFADGELMTVALHVFRPDAVDDVHVFKVPQLPRGPVFFSDELVGLAERADLIGVGFRLLWESPADSMARTNRHSGG